MTAPTIYRWDDDEAPVLRGVAGSMIEVLTGCLVDGYGEKAGAGWQLEFQNPEKTRAAFRNNPTTRTGFFLYVDEDTPAATHTTCLGCELMTDIDSIVAPFQEDTGYNVRKSFTGDTTPRPWLVVSSEGFFYIFIWNEVTGGESAVLPPRTAVESFAFGDFNAANVDGYNCLITYARGYSTSIVGYVRPEYAASAGNEYTRCPRDINGTPGAALNLWNGAIGGPHQMKGLWSGIAETRGVPYVTGRFIVSKQHLGDAYTTNYRGGMPGLYVPCHNAEDLETLTTIDESGRSFLLIRFGASWSSYIGNVFIALEIGVEWDD